MPVDRERRSTLNTFVVRLWCEPEEGRDRWRGQVQRLQSGECVEFSSEAALLSFIRRWVQMPDGRDFE
ncbi:MAG: hypothetical protein JW918_08575 [Anaerolineae bacterium]|nr:hypothetical protein [Anaerolineae bacterium]